LKPGDIGAPGSGTNEPLPVSPFLPGQEPEMMLIPPGIEQIPAPRNETGAGELPPLQPTPQAVPDLAALEFPVSKFTIKYGQPNLVGNKLLPSPAQQLINQPVKLAKTPAGYSGVTPPQKGEMVNLSALKGTQVFSGDALLSIYVAISQELNKKGIYGIFVTADPAQIDPQTANDLRGKDTNLTIEVFASQIEQIRTVSRPITKPPFKGGEPKIDSPADKKYIANSPLKPGSLLLKAKLQDYLERINRFPGRRVDAAVTASGKPGGVILDYVIRQEQPPIFLYAQASNTGTKSTGSWRERFGMDYRQPFKMDDILNLEYDTSDFSHSYSGLGSYEFTPIFPDVLKVKFYGSYGQYTASDVGFDLLTFSGRSWTAGAIATYTPFFVKGYPVDIFAGAEWKYVDVINPISTPPYGRTDFFLPYIGVSTDRTSDRYSIFGSVQVQANDAGLAHTSANQIQNMGRESTDRNFVIGRWDFSDSFFLEPIIFGDKWRQHLLWTQSTLANELAFMFRGQYTFDEKRLVPQFEDVVGGFNSVRGYPESIAAGDNALIGTAEYRFHLPMALKPTYVNQEPDKAPPKFAIRPEQIFAKPDWDLIFRAFVDVGAAFNNNRDISTEADRTLVGVGVGIELQVLRYLDLRVDYGLPVEALSGDKTSTPVKAWDGRFHIVGTVTW
jgi:hemolysin activation/secretion protein